MSLLVGVHPGGRSKFAVCSLFLSDHLPASVIAVRSHSGVDEIVDDIIGLVGEWGELTAVTIEAPLTWSGTPSGWRGCDLAMQRSLPPWAPRTWLRPPNVLPGAVAVQGPALAWALAREIKEGTLPRHPVYESHPRISLAGLLPDARDAVLGYRQRELDATTQRAHVNKLVDVLAEAGLLKLEVDPPRSSDELDALVCALTGLGAAIPSAGLVVKELAAGNIRPVGERSVLVLKGLP